MEELTLKSKQLEAELGMTSKKLEVAVLMAHDDADKIKSSEEIVRSLTLQVHLSFACPTFEYDSRAPVNGDFNIFLLLPVDECDQERSRQHKETPKLVLM